MAKIVVTYGVPMEGFASLTGHEIVAPGALSRFTEADFSRHIADADAIVACTKVDAAAIEAARKLKLIVCYGAGYDAIDIPAATKRGVMVCNTPECVSAPTAEHAVALLMALAKRIPEHDRLTRELASGAFGLGRRMGASLEGATLGIVGMGRIGGRVADFGLAMGMRVIYVAQSPKPQYDARGCKRVTLDALMSESDFVSVHCPLTPQTQKLISARELALMKPSAFFINTARGAIVDEAALLKALQTRSIAGAGLDVFCHEPDIDPAFFALDNVILTPHVGSNTTFTRNQMAEAASERILDMLAGRMPQNLLNPEALK